MGMYVKRCMIFGLSVLVILSVVGCDRETDLQGAIAKATVETSELNSYRSVGNTTTNTGNETFKSSFEAEYAAPDRSHTLWIARDDGSWIETIAIGENGYMRSSTEPQWQICQSFTPGSEPLSPLPAATSSTDPISTHATITNCSFLNTSLEEQLEYLNYLGYTERLPEEEIDGVLCSHYYAKLDSDSYAAMLERREREEFGQITEMRSKYFERIYQRELDVELWVDGNDYIRQLKTEMRYPYIDCSTCDGTWSTQRFAITRYFDFNELICIEAP